MKQISLGELKIPAVALGTWSWGFGGIAGGDSVFGNRLSEAELKPVFDYAMSKGLTLWDTATVYGSGASEKILGEFVKERKDAIISTKFTPILAQGRGDEAMEEFLEGSLKTLHKNAIDIYWIHNTDDVPRWSAQLVPLLKSGKVRKVGVSNHNLEQIKFVNELLKKVGFKLDAIQNHYSLLYTNIEDGGILKYCKDEDIAVFAYMVLEQGALGGKYTKDNPMPADTRRGEAFPPQTLARLEPLFEVQRSLAKKYGTTPALIATAWAIAKGAVPIIGVTKKEQVDDAERASEISLSTDEVAQLEAAAKQTGVTVKGEWEGSM
ncbi:aldo/keto reductase [uncultured Campylobacter sp.]|uniref:aldo/keto reductase n=1 Tax=uncultured Campylobacter sp. TaxID=218934 RepID=UPI00261EFEC4|nr:aldo/keto reductase [uncultured Campylobacter sp.]